MSKYITGAAREQVAKAGNGVWYDVVLMERRSKIAGVINVF